MGNVGEKNWDEKYKPKTCSEIVGQPNIMRKVNNFVQTGRFQHLLLIGPPGVGKTSTARSIANDFFGAYCEENFNEFNASSSRGIDFVRDTIHSIVITVPVRAKFHIIFLDEADALTNEAQTALRQIMMKHTDTCKFVLGCNYPHKIIKPIRDRCAELRFGYLPANEILKKLIEIVNTEGLTYDDGALELMASHAGGSLRKAIQYIEIYLDVNNHLSYDFINDDMKFLDPGLANALLQKAFKGDFEGIQTQVETLFYEGGFCAAELLEAIHAEIVKMKMKPEIKRDLIFLTAEYDWRVTQGSNEKLQMLCYLESIYGIVTPG